MRNDPDRANLECTIEILAMNQLPCILVIIKCQIQIIAAAKANGSGHCSRVLLQFSWFYQFWRES
jgi:hypothetical protein